MYAQLIPRIRYQRDQWTHHLLVLQTRVECLSRKTHYRDKPRLWVPQRDRAGDVQLVTCKESDKMISISQQILNSSGTNLDVKINSRVNWAHYVFMHALSTEISLHLKTFPLLCLTKYGRISEMLFMPETSLVIRSKSLNFCALICPLLENPSQFSSVPVFMLERPLGGTA